MTSGTIRSRAAGPLPRRAALPAPRVRLSAWLDAWLGRPPARTRTGLQRERHAPDYTVLVAIVALAAVGILMVYSSSGLSAYLEAQDSLAIVGPQLVWACLGVVAMVVTMRLDYRWWRLVSLPLYLAALVLLVVVLLPGVGVVVGGSARWLQIRPLPAVHPAEFAKLALVIYLAHWLAVRGGRVSSVRWGTIPFLILAGPIILLVVREPDLGTSGVLTITAFTMFWIAGANLWQFAMLIPAGLAGLAVVIASHGYQAERVKSFLDPWADPTGAGFHTIQGLIALGLGGLLGTGLGASRQAAGLYLPNAFNDYIFAIIGEEFGLLGGLIVIGLFALLAYQGIRIALNAPDTFGGLLAAGITVWLTAQAFINIAVVVNLIPVTGITLPFVSAGGSSLIISFAAAGILLSISRETQPRGTWNDADPDRRRWIRRPHPSSTGGRQLAPRARAGR
ncbi:MAG TPA: putative lipid II flippase FtsW [Candidatus Limnocylindrales bacterium]|nr:putative lipid II flippase FtsW [Candidatus Limnocylindrales bacterium]